MLDGAVLSQNLKPRGLGGVAPHDALQPILGQKFTHYWKTEAVGGPARAAPPVFNLGAGVGPEEVCHQAVGVLADVHWPHGGGVDLVNELHAG